MIEQSLARLHYLCDHIPDLLLAIPENDFSSKPLPGKWSKKEILGHLIDSATNNHQRFVRVQFETAPTIRYDQNQWNAHSYHNQADKTQLIGFWASYNKQLLALLKLITKSKLLNECNTGGQHNVTLAFLITDYVEHLEHHLRQIVSYD